VLFLRLLRRHWTLPRRLVSLRLVSLRLTLVPLRLVLVPLRLVLVPLRLVLVPSIRRPRLPRSL
jgi:hypothetical protein